jgi:hypothetical protein
MIDATANTSSSDIRQVDGDTDGLRRPPSIAEWEDASCGSFISEERSAFYKLAAKTDKSSQEQLHLKAFGPKVREGRHMQVFVAFRSKRPPRVSTPGKVRST